jgi:leucyl-tRNA synthetase
LSAMDSSFPATTPVVSTIGFDGEGQLRRFRRRTVADVLMRYTSQILGQPVTLLDVAAVDGVDEVTRKRLTTTAVGAFNQLPQARLVVSDNRLTLRTDDLLERVVAAGQKPPLPEAILSAQRVAIGGSRGILVRFARTDGGGDIEVFTTRPDTLFGASFVAVSPSHPVAQRAEPGQLAAFRAECDRVRDDPNAKVGVPLSLSVHNPLLPERALPVWLANFVVETYGTGAAGGCPACDQRDLDFARRYGLPVFSIICPPGMDPTTFQVGASAYAGDGTIINSGFLSGLPVATAIDTAIARLVQVGLGTPTTQFRRPPFVVAAPSASSSDVHHLGQSWRFTEPFLTAAALVLPAVPTTWRPHLLHVTVPELATRHLLDARILLRALQDGRGLTYEEPWEEVILIGDVLDSSGKYDQDAPAWGSDALRLAVLADAPPDRELEWSDGRYAAALKFVERADRLFSSRGSTQGVDKAALAGKIAKASASLQGALGRRRTNTAVAAVREIVGGAAECAEQAGLGSSAQAFVASLVYSMLPDLAAKGFAAAGSLPIAPPWPGIAEQGDDVQLIELVVQINGKKRGTVRVPPDADEERVIAAVRADAPLNAHLGEKPIRKTIVVPNRLVNLVV